MKAIKNLLGGLLLVIVLIILDREIGEEEPMQKKHTGKWMLFCILSLALLGLMNKCLNAQMTSDPFVYINQNIPNPFIKVSTGKIEVVPTPFLAPRAMATTTCTESNKPVFLVRPEVVRGPVPLYNFIVGHELVHASQIERFKKHNCREFMRWVNDTTDRTRLVMHEAEAFCKMMEGITNLQYDKEFENLVETLFKNYTEEKVPRDEIAKLIKENCSIWSRRSYGPP